MNEHLSDIIYSISKGDTSVVESFLRQPGGRKYLENITLILINALPGQYGEKKEMYLGFVEVLNHMEGSIRQKEGQSILQQVFQTSADDKDE
jgi:hypothetical protein